MWHLVTALNKDRQTIADKKLKIADKKIKRFNLCLISKLSSICSARGLVNKFLGFVSLQTKSFYFDICFVRADDYFVLECLSFIITVFHKTISSNIFKTTLMKVIYLPSLEKI